MPNTNNPLWVSLPSYTITVLNQWFHRVFLCKIFKLLIYDIVLYPIKGSQKRRFIELICRRKIFSDFVILWSKQYRDPNIFHYKERKKNPCRTRLRCEVYFDKFAICRMFSSKTFSESFLCLCIRSSDIVYGKNLSKRTKLIFEKWFRNA